MATRSIVTSHPEVACDVCGRRLLRGEQPDVFLSGGQRRMVCELCVPRAAHEGWLREAEEPSLTMRPAGPRRTRSLLGRLRQLRESPGDSSLPVGDSPPIAVQESDYEGLYDFLDSAPPGSQPVPAVPRQEAVAVSAPAASEPSPAERKMARALEVFNRSEHPRRVAGVTRSLGSPSVQVALTADSEHLVTVLVAWDLCWYRYQVDLDDEQAGAQLAAQGMELEELPEHERVANAAADERGALSLLA
ncbi:MAG TPA: hypothetical protein VID70_09360 [Solirubrobacteraceae bacterium]|jgi:hypothetical protein